MSKKLHPITDELLDQLLANYQKPEDLIGAEGILKQLTKKLVERALDAELTHHLGHDKHQPVGNSSGSTRNGFSRKKLKGEFGELPIEIPRDRHGTFEPQIVEKHQTRWVGFDDKILSLYARGMTVRVKAVYLALGINLAGEKEILGLWIAQSEGAKFWLQVVTELRNRGVQDIFIACVDGLKGFPEAIEAVFPHTSVQLCIVHMVRHGLNYVSWKRRAEVAADLKRIYQSSTADEAELCLGEFETKWDDDYLPIGQSWRRNWARITPFFDFPPEIRKVIYTTNAIESVNMSLRKITKNRGSFPSDEALLKLFYLALRNISKKWTMPIRDWKAALTRFTISYEGRLPQ